MPRHHGNGHHGGGHIDPGAIKSVIDKLKDAWNEWLHNHGPGSGSHGGGSGHGPGGVPGHGPPNGPGSGPPSGPGNGPGDGPGSGSGNGNGNGSGNGNGNGNGNGSGNGGGGGNGGNGGNSGNGSGGGSGSGSGGGGGGGSGGSGGGGSNGGNSGGGNDGGAQNGGHGSSTTSRGNDSHNTTPAGHGTTSQPAPATGSSPTNSTVTPPDGSLSGTPTNSTLPGGTSPTLSSGLPGDTSLPQAGQVKRVNIAAIVAPIVVIGSLLFFGALAFFLIRRRRLQRQTRLGSNADVSFMPAMPPRRPSVFANLATRLRGGAPSTPAVPPALMVQQPSEGSRPLSYASTVPGGAFEVRHPFAAPLHVNNSEYDSSVAFGTGSSYGAAHGHSGSYSGSGAPPFSHSASSPSLPGLYGHRYGASASGSIVGSGVFSLASAHLGHGAGITPGNEIGNPFNDPAPLRPYSVTGTDESSRSESQLGRHSQMFIPDPDAPPVPPKPMSPPPQQLMSPMSPETPGSAHPLLAGREESSLPYTGSRDSATDEPVVQHARLASLTSATFLNAPAPQSSA